MQCAMAGARRARDRYQPSDQPVGSACLLPGLVASNGVNGSPPSEADPTGSGIQGYFRLTYFQSGLLPAFFLIGLMVSSPVFAEACKYHNAFRLLGIGMGVWTAAVLAAGLAPTYGLLLLARAFVGVGEASFVALAAPFIDDYAPAGSKTRWLSLFYLCIPTGFAGGYIVGACADARRPGIPPSRVCLGSALARSCIHCN